MKRIVDILTALFLLATLFPFMILIGILIVLSSNGPALFKQIRVGRNGKNFSILKFRSMRTNTEHKGQLTVGGRDPRVTRIGYVLRKFKIDEWKPPYSFKFSKSFIQCCLLIYVSLILAHHG